MKQLWAPWRMTYLLNKDEKSEKNCVFCVPDKTDEDAERLILFRGKLAFVVMNKYPYTNGHLLIVPYRHIADISDLLIEETIEMHQLLIRAQKALQLSHMPQGFNIGINVGRIAGAGIADHLHMHLVPRWPGDTNFMPVFSEVRVIPQHLEETYARLLKCFNES